MADLRTHRKLGQISADRAGVLRNRARLAARLVAPGGEPLSAESHAGSVESPPADGQEVSALLDHLLRPRVLRLSIKPCRGRAPMAAESISPRRSERNQDPGSG